jgi:hypothetical protein
MKNKFIEFLLVICLVIPLSTLAANQERHCQPEKVTLSGVLKITIFPAPPKKEYIGDKKEIYRYLILDSPINVVPQKGDLDKDNELQEDIKDIQIVRVEDTYDDSFIDKNQRKHSNWSDKFIDKHIIVSGMLYSRVIRVVMIAEHFAEIK